MTKTLFAALALAVVSLSSQAQSSAAASTPLINKKQATEQQRIEKGQASGQITSQEAAHLEKREQHVTNLETQAQADGKVTAQERTRVRAAERRTSHHIHNQAHDKQASAAN